jgi:2,4-dienoyl-CoA reductase-like NADH-dependent reductase (Old Yellow Enzyme family)
MERCFQEKRLGNSQLKLKSLFIRSAAFEGMQKDGLPTEALTEHHVAMAKGGVGLTTVSYGAVSPEARTFHEQMYINPQSLEKLALLASEVHESGGKVAMQLTHCGYFTKNIEVKRPGAPSRVLNAYGILSGIIFSREMGENDMEKVVADFTNAALGIKEAGFDAVEIHMGHGYLLSQFLSPVTNKRKDAYGGSMENRSRFPLEVVRRIMEETGPGFPVLVKLNLSDGLRKGFSLEDCKYVAKKLEEIGCTAIVLSGGFTSKSPFYLMRGKVPLLGMARNGDNFAEKLTMALFGPLIVRKYKFEENFFLSQAKEIRAFVTMPLVYLGGVDSKTGIMKILEAGFDFIALARALIHDSDFLLKLKDGSINRTECNRCNKCVVEMDRQGVKCVMPLEAQ